MVSGAPGRTYRILEVIGRGGFGTVYRAELCGAEGFTKQVALKVMNADVQAPAEIIARLRDEARILGLLRHRAIVGVDGLARFDEGWAVVMELVPGVDLEALVAAGPTPVRVALEIAEEVASALHAAWAVPPEGRAEPLRLVHRDLKPSNVRLTAQGEVKVLDFGVARADFAAREARTSAFLYGSIKYMAIERLEGEEGPAGDVYALGLVLAELIAGRDLPEPPRQAERFAAFLEETLDAVAEAARAGCPAAERVADLRDLVRAMLCDHMERRPSAAEVERTCRVLRQGWPGPWLREWSAVEVPRLAALQPPVPRSPESGSVLMEVTGAAPAASAGVAPRGALRPLLVLGGLACGLGLGATVLYFAWSSVQPPDDLASGAVPAAPAPAPEPAAPNPAPVPAPGPTMVGSPASAPGPAPAPRRPTVRATPPPVAPPEPVAEAPSADAEVALVGDARSVWLVSSTGRHPAGTVPAGTYEIKAWFDGPEPVSAGTVVVHAGERLTLRCTSAMARCARVD